MFPTQSPERWGINSMGTMNTVGTATTIAGTGISVPPSRRIRAAQKVKLMEKTHISFKDVQRQCKDLVKTYQEMEDTFKAFSETAEDMAKQFGPHGQASHEYLRESSAQMYEAAHKCTEGTKDIFGTVSQYCGGVRSCEPAYRRAYKKQVRATEKCARSAQNPHLGAGKSKKLQNDQAYAQINSDFARTSYEDSRFHMALVLLDGLLKQSNSVIEAFAGCGSGEVDDSDHCQSDMGAFASFDGAAASAEKLPQQPRDLIGNTLMMELSNMEAPIPQVSGLNVRSPSQDSDSSATVWANDSI